MFKFLRLKSVKWRERLLFFVIFILLLIVLGLVYAILNLEPRVIFTQKDIVSFVDESGEEVLQDEEIYPQARAIEKTDELKTVENSLRIDREIVKLPSGEVKIIARIADVDLLGENVILHDFVEDIRFEKKVELSGARVVPYIGTLFPLGEDIMVSNYGPGPVDEKPTRVNIVILDVNISKDSTVRDLYEFIFMPDVDIDELYFSGPEFRSGKFILKTGSEIVSL